MNVQSSAEDPLSYEDDHVHQVYEAIASHFSSTRFKPWPLVSRFLKSQPNGAIGLDVGCGNGKYMTVNRNVFIVGSDRSSNLVQIASKHQPHSSIVADGLSLPHRCAFFDFAISIAVIHHLSTSERRIEAIKSVLKTLRPPEGATHGGTALFYVWALEQKQSRRGWDRGDQQDVMVPWVTQSASTADAVENSKTYDRYYHLYHEGELEQDILIAGGTVVESGYEKDNWWAIASCSPGTISPQ